MFASFKSLRFAPLTFLTADRYSALPTIELSYSGANNGLPFQKNSWALSALEWLGLFRYFIRRRLLYAAVYVNPRCSQSVYLSLNKIEKNKITTPMSFPEL